MSTVTTTAGTAGTLVVDRPAVLLINDNRPDRQSMARLLRRQFGKRIRLWEAEDGQSGLEILRRHPIDVVLVDYLLADMDVLEWLDELAKARLDTVAVVVAGQASRSIAGRCMAQGAHDYILKQDLDQDRVQSAVTSALRTRRLKRENARIVRQLRQTNRELEYFVRALSHDMSANFMLLESSFCGLKKSLGEPPRSELEEIVAHVDACLGESRRFLDDLVRLAKTGSVEMEPARVKLDDVVDEVLFEQNELLERRAVEVHLRRPLPQLWCNRRRVKQIVTNLVRNALKHGCNPKRPQISISAMPRRTSLTRPESRPMAVIRIHDNGPGIEPKMREEIFLPGRRLPEARGDGSGMGLAIVRKIAAHYGGSARVDPDCASGTALLVSLPAGPEESSLEHHGPHLPP